MTIAWDAFTPWHALAGGVLIGLSAALFALLNGRIAGISGVLGGLLRPQRGDIGWRVAFVGGLLLAPALWALVASVPTPLVPPCSSTDSPAARRATPKKLCHSVKAASGRAAACTQSSPSGTGSAWAAWAMANGA